MKLLSVPAFVWGAWREMSWRMTRFTIVAGLALAAIWMTAHQGFFVFIHRYVTNQAGELFSSGLANLALMQAFAFVFLLCILVAARAVAGGAPRVGAYAVAVVVAAALAAAIDLVIKLMTGFYEGPDVQWWWKPVDAAWYFLTIVVLGAPCTFVYADWRRAQTSAARLHAAGLARTRASRDVLQTRLQALQARVEPQFLFETLARVKLQYDRDPAQGETTLDALIAYLRMAMPEMRRAGSNLARECELARTYVEIVASRGDARLRMSVDDGEKAVRVSFPPMVLLPLVDHAIVCSRITPLDDNSIDLRAEVLNERLGVTVAHSGDAFADESPAVRSVRGHLQSLFDTEANIEARSLRAGGSQIRIEVPHEPCESSDR